MKRLLFSYLLINFMMNLSADAQVTDITGEYVKRGGGEMVAAFVFKQDSLFEFYFIYGAVDRMAKGKYFIKDGKVSLEGTKIPAKDFNVKGSHTNTKGTTIKVEDPTPALTQHVMCLFEKNGNRDVQYTDENGNAHSEMENCDNIFVMSMLFKDIMSTVVHGREKEDHNNHYSLTLNPSLAEVSFADFAFTIKGNTLIGTMPYLWEEDESVFEKQELNPGN